MKYNNIDYQRCVLICMVVMIHIVNFSTLYPDEKKLYKLLFHASVFVDYRLFGKHQKNV